MNENYVRNLGRAYMRSLDERMEWQFKVQSSLIVVLSATFAVMISLNNPSTDKLCSKVLLTFALATNVLSILFSAISLYETIAMSKKALNTVRREIDKLSPDGPVPGQSYGFLSVPRCRFFAVCETCSYISFLVYVLALAAYGIARIYVH